MPRKEVQRWDPPNREMPKYPVPLWGNTSTYIRANDVAGPVFPVKRNNDYAANAPQEKPPAHETSCSYPVIPIEVRNSSFQTDVIQDVGGMPKLVVGPKYTEGDGKNGYVPAKPVADKMPPQVNFPIIDVGVEAQNHFLPTLPPKIDAPKVMSYPMLPIEDHGSKYTTQEFGCSGKGLKIDRQKPLAAPGNRDTGDRNACLITPKNMYQPEKPVSHPVGVMFGPKMPNIVESHKYGPVPQRVAPAAARMEMPGPVFPGVDAKNHYSKVEEKQYGQLIQQAPVFRGVEASNCYAPVEEKQPGQLILAGPVFRGVDDQCKYVPEVRKADTESLLAFQGPVFRGVSDNVKYFPETSRAPIEGTRLMTAPIFPGITAENKYGPVEPPLSPENKIKTDKPFTAPKYPGIESKNNYKLEKIENGFPEKDEGSQHIMTGPKYPGIEESHKFGPVSDRKPKVEEAHAPIYIADGANKYSHVPEKVYGDLIQQAPVFRGVESANCYAPVEEKQPGQLVLAGPVFRGVDDQCKYVPEVKKADTESLLAFQGPVFRGVSDNVKYFPETSRAPIEGQRLMTAPVFPGIEPSNCYGPASMGF